MFNINRKGYRMLSAIAIAAVVVLQAGCSGDEGSEGADGRDGSNGKGGDNGLTSLVVQTSMAAGNTHCFKGGLQIDSGMDTNSDGELAVEEITATSHICAPTLVNSSKNFNRIATFPVCTQLDASCNNDTVTAAEIVAASSDGLMLIYTDSPAEQIGFVDIANPAKPLAAGILGLNGEPTSVAVTGNYALVAVNTSVDFVNVSGELAVVDIATQMIVTSLDLGGQPDSVAVSPDGAYAAIVIENERDEDLDDGAPPQAPAGNLVVVTLNSAPDTWTTNTVNLTGIAERYPGDPEPEFVDINSDNIAVVTLQENNHIVLVNLADGSIVNEFSAGALDLNQIDITEEDTPIILQTQSLDGVLREPDGVSWINSNYLVTADEGDLNGGSRSFTIFNTAGDVVWSSGSSLDLLAAQLGHYPDARSENKGSEPENAEVGIFGEDRYLFINSERASLVFVYDIADATKPVLKQTLPAAMGPEGALAIPSRNLLVVASEEDARADGFRAALNIYAYNAEAARYPTMQSLNRESGSPIAWSALSGLAADPQDTTRVYAIEDSAYQQSRIFTLDVSVKPANLIAEMRLRDSNDVFASVIAAPLVSANETVGENDPSRIDLYEMVDLAALINADKTLNLDPEGIAVASAGGFWIASEGAGTVGEAGRPVNSLNFVFKADADGIIEEVISLPDELNQRQLRFGFEGIAEFNGAVYVAFQRVWPNDTDVRIGIYDLTEKSWSFVFYPLDAPESQNGGWVGLSDLTALGNGEFLVLERDNQSGPDATIKRLYKFNITDVPANSTVSKVLVRDVMADLAKTGGLIPEKIEGLAVLANGEVIIVNDNDGVDDNSGETLLINLGTIL